MLAGVIPGAPGDRNMPGNGCNIHNPSAPAFTHTGQDKLCQPGQSKDVDLKLPAGFVKGNILDRSVAAIARIIDEDIDPAITLEDGCECLFYGGLVFNIQGNGTSPDTDQIGNLFRITGRGPNGMTRFRIRTVSRPIPAEAPVTRMTNLFCRSPAIPTSAVLISQPKPFMA